MFDSTPARPDSVSPEEATEFMHRLLVAEAQQRELGRDIAAMRQTVASLSAAVTAVITRRSA